MIAFENDPLKHFSLFVSRSAKSGGALGLCGSDCYLASWRLVQSDAYIVHILQGFFFTLSLLLTPLTHFTITVAWQTNRAVMP